MSNRVETTTTPAEVKSSSKSSSKGSSSVTSKLQLEKFTQTLSKEYPAKKQKKKQTQWWEYQLLKAQYDALGEILQPDTNDSQMTKLLDLAKEGTRRSVVTTVIRQQDIDRLGIAGPNEKGKRAEFLVYYTLEYGRDRYGKEIPPPYISHGLDKQAIVEKQFDEDGQEIQPKLTGRYFDVFTIPFSKEALDEALKDQDLDGGVDGTGKPIQFNVKAGNADHGKYTYEEIAELPLEELLERGRLGKTGTDLTVMYSELSTKDKLHLQEQAALYSQGRK